MSSSSNAYIEWVPVFVLLVEGFGGLCSGVQGGEKGLSQTRDLVRTMGSGRGVMERGLSGVNVVHKGCVVYAD